MKLNGTLDGKNIEVEITDEQVRNIIEPKQSKINFIGKYYKFGSEYFKVIKKEKHFGDGAFGCIIIDLSYKSDIIHVFKKIYYENTFKHAEEISPKTFYLKANEILTETKESIEGKKTIEFY